MQNFDYTTFLSPFTWRYGSDVMRRIWSEVHKRKLWRKIWVALATAQAKEGLVSKEELNDLIAHQNDIDMDKAHEIEKEIQHDLMAEIKTYASQATKGGGKIHLGATSMDIEDNADTIRIKESMNIVEEKLKNLLSVFGKKIEQYKNLPCMGYTHLQPAEPTTLGLRFSLYAQDLLFDLQFLQFAKKMTKGKGIKGSVGTSASYSSLLRSTEVQQMEEKVMKELGIDAVTIASQTAPRKLEYFVASLLSSISQSLYKFAFDMRIMQSPGFGEWQEPFGQKQVGSSAMPFKRNPWKAEQICSLARLVFHLSEVTRDNAAHMLLERTLDDSPNRRVVFPEMFLAVDAILTNATNIMKGLVINEKQIAKNLAIHGPFAATEAVLMAAVKKGGNRQELHEALRNNAMKAHKTVQQTGKNPLTNLLKKDPLVTKHITSEEIAGLMNPTTHIGLAPKMCEDFLKELEKSLQ